MLLSAVLPLPLLLTAAAAASASGRVTTLGTPHWPKHSLKTPAGDSSVCRDRRLSPFGAGSLWNTAIGSGAVMIPASIYPRSAAAALSYARDSPAAGPAPSKQQCANMTTHPEQRHTCPGAFGGITAAQCAAKGCCFSDTHCTGPCPWCFTPDQEFGPRQFHSDADHFVAVSASDPLVSWWIQGWWGTGGSKAGGSTCVPTPANCFCHCEVLPDAPAFAKKLHLPYEFVTNRSDGCAGNNGLAMLQPDNITVIQTQPAYRCTRGGPLLSKSGANASVGCPNGHPLAVDITSSGPETALGAHGGSGLSAIGGVIRLHEIGKDAPPIAHALKLELFAHEYYFGGGKAKRRLQPPSSSNGGRTQYVWPATGSDSYTWETCKPKSRCLAYGGTNQYLAPGSLLALPAGVAKQLRSTLRTEPARRVADAFRDFGGYIVDDTASDSASLTWESGASEAFEQEYGFPLDTAGGDWYKDLVEIFQALHIVINNKPGSVGGGGTPRVAPLPPLCGTSEYALRMKTDEEAGADREHVTAWTKGVGRAADTVAAAAAIGDKLLIRPASATGALTAAFTDHGSGSPFPATAFAVDTAALRSSFVQGEHDWLQIFGDYWQANDLAAGAFQTKNWAEAAATLYDRMSAKVLGHSFGQSAGYGPPVAAALMSGVTPGPAGAGPRPPLLARPPSAILVATVNHTKPPLFIFRPLAPAGYISLGDILSNSSTPPDFTATASTVRVVRESCATPCGNAFSLWAVHTKGAPPLSIWGARPILGSGDVGGGQFLASNIPVTTEDAWPLGQATPVLQCLAAACVAPAGQSPEQIHLALGPVQPKSCVSICATRTLNATGYPRATLSPR